MEKAHSYRTALIVHGYNLHQSDWDHVMCGDPDRGLMGRIPTALLLAYRRKPSLIIWNTGASEKNGVREAQYIFEYALENMTRFRELFADFKEVDLPHLASHLREVSVLELESMRTNEALENAIRHLTLSAGEPAFAEVMQVSSKNHVSRVLRDSIALWWEAKGLYIPTSGYAAQTGYGGGTAGEVEIHELRSDKRSSYDVERVAGLRAM